MSIELSKESRTAAVLSIERYFFQTAALLNFFLDEIGPSIYNQAVANVQERMPPPSRRLATIARVACGDQPPCPLSALPSAQNSPCT